MLLVLFCGYGCRYEVIVQTKKPTSVGGLVAGAEVCYSIAARARVSGVSSGTTTSPCLIPEDLYTMAFKSVTDMLTR